MKMFPLMLCLFLPKVAATEAVSILTEKDMSAKQKKREGVLLETEDFTLLMGTSLKVYYWEMASEGKERFTPNFSTMTLQAETKDKIKGVLTLALDSMLHFGNHTYRGFSWDTFIRDAYVAVKPTEGRQIVLLVGKQKLPFSQGINILPYLTSASYLINSFAGVFAVTADITGLVPELDGLKFSIAESESNDLNISGEPAFVVNIKKNIAEGLAITASMMNKENRNDFSPAPVRPGRERRTSLGFITTTPKRDFYTWLDFIHLDNYPLTFVPDSTDYGLQAGISRVFREQGISLVLEGGYIEKFSNHYGAGIFYNWSKRVTLSGEVTQIRCEVCPVKDDTFFGIRVKYKYGVVGDK